MDRSDRIARAGESGSLWSLLAAGWFAAAALAVNVVFLDGISRSSITIHATVAAGASALPTWYVLVESAGGRRLVRGALAGLVVGVLVVPVTLFVVMVETTGFVMGLVTIPGIVPMSIFGLLFYGWLTVPAGAIAGGSLGAFRRLADRGTGQIRSESDEP